MCGIGIIVSAYLHNIYHLYISYGLVLGIGSSMIYTPTLVMAGRWFKRYQAETTCFMMCGAPLGSIIFNPLMEIILENFNLRSVMKVYGVSFLSVTLTMSLSYIPFSLNSVSNSKQAKKEGDNCQKVIQTKEKSGFSFRWSLLKNRGFVFFLIGRLFAILAYYIPLFHLVSLFLFNLYHVCTHHECK
jgi:Major Facilitator Superfamily.